VVRCWVGQGFWGSDVPRWEGGPPDARICGAVELPSASWTGGQPPPIQPHIVRGQIRMVSVRILLNVNEGFVLNCLVLS
jgi:hypothetical protein